MCALWLETTWISFDGVKTTPLMASPLAVSHTLNTLPTILEKHNSQAGSVGAVRTMAHFL